MITERTLRQWRRDALHRLNNPYMAVDKLNPEAITTDLLHYKESNERILRLTQVLLDQNLLRRKS